MPSEEQSDCTVLIERGEARYIQYRDGYKTGKRLNGTYMIVDRL
jgi:hypothetical protein